MTAQAAVLVQEPGIYHDLPEETYHADDALASDLGRSLSHGGALRMLKSPAAFAWYRDHPQPPRDAFDLGHVAHRLILGSGGDYQVVDQESWVPAAAKRARQEARDAGLVPILRKDLEAVQTMAQAVADHATAGPIFRVGAPEVSLYWTDDATGVTCRGRVDWHHPSSLVDLKTTRDAGPGFARDAGLFGYYEQADWYARGWLALTGEALPFTIVAVEKEPPHLVRVFALDDPVAMSWARTRNDRALALYAHCESLDEWPGYPDQVETLVLPHWVVRAA